MKSHPGFTLLALGAMVGIPVALMKLGDWVLWGWLFRVEALMHPEWPRTWGIVACSVGFIVWFWAARKVDAELFQKNASESI